MFEDQMGNMDIDGMMKQMMTALNPDAANNDMENNPFA